MASLSGIRRIWETGLTKPPPRGKQTMIATIQIGNSDDKLSQVDWSKYIAEVRKTFNKYQGIETHFAGGSPYDAPWQNACFVVSVPEVYATEMIKALTTIRKRFKQKSIAIVLGDVREI